MKKITYQELLAEMDPSVHENIASAARAKGATHVALARNEQMDSSAFGDKTVAVVGPNCTFKTPEDCAGQWLGDLPSQRKYFVAYAEVPLIARIESVFEVGGAAKITMPSGLEFTLTYDDLHGVVRAYADGDQMAESDSARALAAELEEIGA